MGVSVSDPSYNAFYLYDVLTSAVTSAGCSRKMNKI